MTITRDDIRPLESAIDELCCLQSAWREIGGPQDSETQGFMYGRFFDCVEALQDAFGKTISVLSSAEDDGEEARETGTMQTAFLEGEARWMEAHAAVIHACIAADPFDPDSIKTALAGVVDNLERQAERLRAGAEEEADDNSDQAKVNADLMMRIAELEAQSPRRGELRNVRPGETVVSSSELEDQISLVRHCQHAVSSLTDIGAMEEVHKGALYLLEHQLKQIVESLYVVGFGPDKGFPREVV